MTTENYLKAVEMMNLTNKETLFIGDQIFTDILGANRSGIPNILVKFIRTGNKKKIGKRRQLESVILKIYQRHKKYNHRFGNIIRKGNTEDEEEKKF